MKTGHASILELALEARYESHEAFTRAFRSAFGVSPSAFRRANARRTGAVSPAMAAAPTAIRPERRELSALLAGSIVQLPPIRVAFVRHVGPYEDAASAFETLERWGAQHGIDRGAQRIGAPHDDPRVTPRSKLRFDACVVVDGAVTAEGNVGVQQLGGGDYAATCHVGPFDTLAETYSWLAVEWLPGRQRTIAKAPCLELYRDFHAEVAGGIGSPSYACRSSRWAMDD